MFPDEKGLSNSEVVARHKQYGANVLPEIPPQNPLSLFFRQLKSPFVYVLLFAVIITLLIGDYTDSIIISLAVLINTVLGFIQENRANKALFALKHYVKSESVVVRDGKRITINSSKIVPGDIVILSQGTKIPADGKLIFANRLYIDEAALTGESIPVNKSKGDDVFMGTTISSGQATLLIETIGAATKMGDIALQVQEKKEDTPLQKQLKTFSKQLVLVIGVLTIAVFILGLFHGIGLNDIFVTSVALAVSSIPEGLLVSLTVVLAIGMQKIIKHRGLVRKLSAAETLGGVTVICADKTGTLTQGKMKVVDYIGDKKKLAKQVLLANDLDDPIVISAFEWGRKIFSNLTSKNRRYDSIPFSSKEKFFVSLHKWSDNKNMIFVNGAPELLLNWSTLTKKEKYQITKTIEDLTKQGKRIIGFARKEVSVDKKRLKLIDAKNNLSWIGILAFNDPVRIGVKDALNLAKKAGIKTVVITGDFPKTSEFVLSQLGINISRDQILTGDELENFTVGKLSQKVKTVRLFARTTPQQKLMIVDAMKKNGEIVAMMGDGVNDAPALHKADIGIVVGEATDVAKESADLVLLDSNFSTIIGAIEEGRVIFENIRKIILYLMSDALTEIIVVVGGITLGMPLPITAVQILWVNLISDGFPDLALTIDPKRPDIMNERPRLAKEPLVNKRMFTLIGFISLVAGLIALSSFIVVYHITNDVILARSMAFITLGFDSLVYVFSIRSIKTPFWKDHLFENKWLVAAVSAGFCLQILPFTTAPLRQFFGLSNLNPIYWITAIGLAITMFFVVEVFKAL
ncbi:cation-translocating P-type ATPase [Patescibacteria group bacterium]